MLGAAAAEAASRWAASAPAVRGPAAAAVAAEERERAAAAAAAATHEQCSAVEALFVQRRFEEARDAAQRFFEQHFEPPKSAAAAPAVPWVDLSSQHTPPAAPQRALARVAAVLLQCSYELRDPGVCDYVTAVYRQTLTPFPYDLGLVWVQLLLSEGAPREVALQACLEESLRRAVGALGTPRFDYQRYRSFVAVLVHDVLHPRELRDKQQLQQSAGQPDGGGGGAATGRAGGVDAGGEAKGADDPLNVAAEEGAAGSGKAATEVVKESVLSVVDKERFRNELQAEAFCCLGHGKHSGASAAACGDGSGGHAAVADGRTSNSTTSGAMAAAMAAARTAVARASPSSSSSAAGMGADADTAAPTGEGAGAAADGIQSSAVAALRAQELAASTRRVAARGGGGTAREWRDWVLFPDVPAPATAPWTSAFWLAVAAQAVAWLRHLRARLGGAAQGLAVPVGVVILLLVWRKSVAQVLRRFAHELQT